MSENSTQARFTLDEQKARAFLARALRRYAGDLEPSEGEQWELTPGWDLANIFSDESGNIENLVYAAIHEAGAITCPAGLDIDLLMDTGHECDWMYQWRVTVGELARFAICNPYREEFRRLGWGDGSIKAKGCSAAMGIMREAVEYGNSLLDAFTAAGGRVPVAA